MGLLGQAGARVNQGVQEEVFAVCSTAHLNVSDHGAIVVK